jgi:serine/threonine-protein kinase
MPKICPVCDATYPDANVFCSADGTSLRAADLQGDFVGTVIADRYLVTDLLGEGGMGTVYLARHVRLPQQAAIKVLRPEQLRDAAALARFNHEAASASRIDHDRVARVYDYGETRDGTAYLAMEFVPGRTLKQLVADGGPLGTRRAAGIIRQVAEGLDAAHRLGIIHRDLKPENVMVVEDPDGTDRVKVLDFGIAKALDHTAGGARLTRTGYVVGTPEFMSPEQLTGAPVDARSDVYALALLAFQCLSGALPFDASTPERAYTAHLLETPLRLDQVRPTVAWPAEVQAVFDSALARDPADRPATAGAFARALGAAVGRWLPAADGQPADDTITGASRPAPPALPAAPAPPVAPVAQAAPPSDAARPPTPARRRPRIALGAAAAVAVGAAAFFVFGSSRPPDPTTTRPPDATTPPAARDSAPAGSTKVGTADPSATPPPGAPTDSPAATPGRADPRPADRDAAARAQAAAAARRTLDSLEAALDPRTADQATARAAQAALGELLPRLATATDRTWARLHLVRARVLAGDVGGACAGLRAAARGGLTAAQRAAVRSYDAQIGCGL